MSHCGGKIKLAIWYEWSLTTDILTLTFHGLDVEKGFCGCHKNNWSSRKETLGYSQNKNILDTNLTIPFYYSKNFRILKGQHKNPFSHSCKTLSPDSKMRNHSKEKNWAIYFFFPHSFASSFCFETVRTSNSPISSYSGKSFVK